MYINKSNHVQINVFLRDIFLDVAMLMLTNELLVLF